MSPALTASRRIAGILAHAPPARDELQVATRPAQPWRLRDAAHARDGRGRSTFVPRAGSQPKEQDRMTMQWQAAGNFPAQYEEST